MLQRLRCLRYSMSWWVEPAAAGWWKWTLRDRWGCVLGESEGEWPSRERAAFEVAELRALIAVMVGEVVE